MNGLLEAFNNGDYPGAYAALAQAPEAKTAGGIAVLAFLLVLQEQFEQAEALVRQTPAPLIDVMIAGERARLARWRDPRAAGELRAAAVPPFVQYYAGIAVALAARDEALAARAKAELAASIRPVAGQLQFVDGTVRAFADLVDADDAIGQMLELFAGDGVLYVPFAAARRIVFQPATNLLDFRMVKAVVGLRDDSVVTGVVPLLYAGSSTDPKPEIRNGTLTLFDYLGGARRARGQRDFFADRAMIGMSRVRSIELE
jgi:protein involved in temperature-dependent protein secretion